MGKSRDSLRFFLKILQCRLTRKAPATGMMMKNRPARRNRKRAIIRGSNENIQNGAVAVTRGRRGVGYGGCQSRVKLTGILIDQSLDRLIRHLRTFFRKRRVF